MPPKDPPKQPEFPRDGFDDTGKLAELRRQAQQRMEQEERAAGLSPTQFPEARDPMSETVYGAPPMSFGKPEREDTPRTPAPVYGGPPVRPVPARNRMVLILCIVVAVLAIGIGVFLSLRP